MNEEEFLDLVSLHAETWFQPKEEINHKSSWKDRENTICGWRKRYGKLLKEISLDDIIRKEWTTGGIHGGSCWDEDGSDNRYSTPGEPEPEFTELDVLLEKICPDISYFQYKKLVKGLIEYSDYEANEYYGNCTNYGVKSIKLKDLFGRLKEMKLI